MIGRKTLDERTLRLEQWHTPATDYPERQLGNWRIVRKFYSRGTYRYWGLDGYLVFKVNKRIPIATLQEKRDNLWYDWMVDDPPQQRAMEIYAQRMKGRILVAGLGLGLILHELAKNSEVKSVVCVERSKEVIQLVAPNILHLLQPEREKCLLHITQEDFYDFIRTDTSCWDHIFVDLWVTSALTKERAFLCGVLPTAGELVVKYPNTPITFHGFQTISEIKPIDKEMADLIVSMGGL